MKERNFDIPVVIFIFKRTKAVDVINRIALVKPSKLYILADHGRNEDERNEVEECRELVEKAVSWDCEVIKNYSDVNRGVFANIGLGAKWVFEREDRAIFLEDDNLPEVTFFEYCKEMLDIYEEDTRVLWVCGTNYLGEYKPQDGASYVFTKHLLPCGWASWKDKFNDFYDTELSYCGDKTILAKVKNQYYSKRLFKQYQRAWMSEYRKIESGERPSSWDYHMDFAIKANGLYGISPANNQIKNIGVDEHSIHGGTSYDDIMTQRFCGMGSYGLQFPLIHPKVVLPDQEYEKRVAKILQYPFRRRVKNLIIKIKNIINS